MCFLLNSVKVPLDNLGRGLYLVDQFNAGGVTALLCSDLILSQADLKSFGVEHTLKVLLLAVH
jgi:hypothetical protein